MKEHKKTFVVILGYGRTGSSSVVSYLNSYPEFNIYGENRGIILYMLKCLYILRHESFNGRKFYDLIDNSVRTSNLSYKDHKYNKCEYYNHKTKMRTIESKIKNVIFNYFDSEYKYIGFKEIRWELFSNIDFLNILEETFNVKYIFLTRKLEDQVKSMIRTGWWTTKSELEMCQIIKNTNNIISKFLSTKQSNQHITKNTSIDTNFLSDIYNFIIN